VTADDLRDPATPIEGFESGYDTVDGVRLHYWRGGDPDGCPVVLWHGFLGTGYAWREVARALAQQGRHVLVPDMRGYGDSDKPAGVDGYDARFLAEEGRRLVARLGFGAGQRLVHAAHDMGALPALLWTADHPDEVRGLLYCEAPVMLGDWLRQAIVYAPEAMRSPMWWWILPFADGVPERLVVGHERAFLSWFYDGATARPGMIGDDAVAEYLRTFSGIDGVLGSMGIYRAAFTSIAQTEPLTAAKISTPVVAVGGDHGLGPTVGQLVERVAADVITHTFTDCGHFVPEEQPERLTHLLLALTADSDHQDHHERTAGHE
jgi:pimeloyl-ACP methyl ester carboxylesterase